MILLDTNIVSELIENAPVSSVADWFSRQDPAELRISAVVATELRFGAAFLPEGRRKVALCVDIDRVLSVASEGP